MCARPRQLLLLCLAALLPVAEPSQAADREPETNIALSRWAGVGFITAWGLANWDYGEQSLHSINEGWFGASTREGGADKAGHLYTSYLMTRAFTGLYRHWGASETQAPRDALLSSLLLTGFMELGDGFSPYGVSHEDMVMNVAGSLIGYQLATREDWARRLDLRMEYLPGHASDPLTDYSHARYLAVLKLDGFAALADTPLQWLELHAGYYARGYDSPLEQDRRFTYAGLGLNLSRLLRRQGWLRTATTLQYYQIPGTSLRANQAL